MRILKKPEMAPEAKKTCTRPRSILTSAVALIAFAGAMAILPPDPVSPDVSEKTRTDYDILWLGDKIETWKFDLDSGPCGENHRKVLSEVNVAKMRLMETALKYKDLEKEMVNLVDLLINFEDRVEANLEATKKIPECASR